MDLFGVNSWKGEVQIHLFIILTSFNLQGWRVGVRIADEQFGKLFSEKERRDLVRRHHSPAFSSVSGSPEKLKKSKWTILDRP